MITFQNADTVMVRSMRGGIKNWINGVVIAIKGPLTYLVQMTIVNPGTHNPHKIRRSQRDVIQ